MPSLQDQSARFELRRAPRRREDGFRLAGATFAADHEALQLRRPWSHGRAVRSHSREERPSFGRDITGRLGATSRTAPRGTPIRLAACTSAFCAGRAGPGPRRRGPRSLAESGEFDVGPFGRLKRFVRRTRPAPHILELARQGKNWKQEWYARGEHVTVDATAFLAR